MADIEIRQANPLDVAALYDGPAKRSMRAVVVTIDQVPMGLGGIYYDDAGIIAFARIKPELRSYPFAIYKAAVQVMDMVRRRGGTVSAIADPTVARSDAFLQHLGFERVGEVYQWTTLANQPTY